MRTCVGCRVRSAKSDLLRVVAVEGELVPDPRGRLPGRGAHLHPTPDCLALAERRRAFGRALRLTVPIDLDPVRQWVRQWVNRHDQSRARADDNDERSMSQHR
jgi:predicted RNA-binding protein YlxR (DUF448 family)